MTPAALSVVVRRLWPRRVRTRLAVFYAVLFLLAGTVLLALTYALLATLLLPARRPAPPKQLTPRNGAAAEPLQAAAHLSVAARGVQPR